MAEREYVVGLPVSVIVSEDDMGRKSVRFVVYLGEAADAMTEALDVDVDDMRDVAFIDAEDVRHAVANGEHETMGSPSA